MTIEIEGSRSSDDAWREARSVSLSKLKSDYEHDVAWYPDRDAAERLARSLYAMDRTLPELQQKCLKLGRLATDWLRQSGLQFEVSLVRLRCLRGLFDLEIAEDGKVHKLEISEDVFDELLRSGSREALETMDRLFSVNFGRFPILKAS